MTEEGFPVSGPGTDFRSSYLFNTGIAGIEVRVETSLAVVSGWCPGYQACVGCVYQRVASVYCTAAWAPLLSKA